ncbi:MAG: DUF177 domain-containing protein [Betaproteobacteria bacterium]|nr:DUF177 domain-containing protein [Betaproteobacteria bacterium]
MTPDWKATHLDLHRFTHLAGEYRGDTPLAQLPRVLDVCLTWPGIEQRRCQWLLRGELRALAGTNQAWLHLSAELTVVQTCQRCLEPMDVAVLVDRWFRLVADETTALAEDDDCEEDLLAMSHEFNAQALLEDDLLLAMPLVPRHLACHAPLSPALEDDLPHLFAALASLKSPKQ